jgi:transposase-like protein
VSLPIKDIQTDGGTQPRALLDFEAIDDYTDAMAAGAKFPPVTVFYDGERYWLADGFHRVRAAYAADCESIECDVRQGTLEDAQWFSFSANSSNGLRRTNDDKQRAVKAALAHQRATGLSDNEIARHCGVSVPTVAAWREKLGLSIKTLKIGTRTVTRNGKTYKQNTSKIGRPPRKRNPPRPAMAPPAQSTPAEATADPDMPIHEVPAPPAPTRTTRAQRIDRLARSTLSFIEATKHLAHLIGWLGETAGEFDQAELLLSNVGNAIAAVAAEIERTALAADPLNATRLEIQENES